MPIVPLPQFEADVAELEEARSRVQATLPRTLVVRFGVMGMIGEFPYDGDVRPGCGSKLVVRTFRGTELGEMLTSTCPNAGCAKAITRRQMLEYIRNSGGRQYPFFTQGRVLRVAGSDDVQRQAALEAARPGLRNQARALVESLRLELRVVDVEQILGGERITVYLHRQEEGEADGLAEALAQTWGTQVEIRFVGDRDEARLTADYERCGQYCCCKNFLKVLKPVSMRLAKVQKATLDPLKISGRCGRLMCCLRYEEQTYEQLQRRLPKKSQRVETPDGPGIVVATQVLTQLVLVRLEADGREVAVPVEDVSWSVGPPPVGSPAEPDRTATGEPPPPKKKKRKKRRRQPGGSGQPETGPPGPPPEL